jgi:EAL domain-containing protein (putative c-di-GMP-specific phosphodiesterase class I)/GGDEF domain-containing protein
MAQNVADILDRMIERRDVTTVFQPIVDLSNGEPLGAEALLRPGDTDTFANISVLLDAAAMHGRMSDLEAIARRAAFETFFASDRRGLLFLNNSPLVMSEDGFVASITTTMEVARGFDPTRVVLEITERTEFTDFDRLCQQTDQLRNMGFQIALDDVGAGLSGLNRIMALRPDWVKLDRALVSEVDREPLQENLLRSLVHFARLSNMAMIAEGIERYEELQALVEMGVGAGQGFFLARPDPTVHSIDEQVQRTVVTLHRRVSSRLGSDATTTRIVSLARPIPTFDYDCTAAQAMMMLDDIADAPWAVVLNGRRFRGLVTRRDIEEAVSDGRPEVPIDELPRRHGCVLAADATLAEALSTLASRSDEELPEPVVIQRDGAVIGAVTMRQMLRAAADAHRLNNSRLAGLTGLPTRFDADQWLADRIRAGDLHDIAYVDLRDFDAFNLAYGFEKGDAMLMRLVEQLRRVADPARPGETLLAHLGEDRFVLATPNDTTSHLLRLIREFATSHADAFTSADLAAGQFTVPTESGDVDTFPLTTVRVVYLSQPLANVGSPEELHELATRLRHADRSNGDGNNDLVTDRRTRAALRRTA